MDASTVLRAIKKGWYFVLLGLLGAAAVAIAINASAEPFYESSARYIVAPAKDPVDPGTVGEGIRTLDDARSRAIVATFAEVLGSGTIHQEAARSLGLDELTSADYSYRSAILPEANVIELTVRGPNPQMTVLLSGTVGGSASEKFTELYQIYDIVLLDAPTTPTAPSNPTLLQTLVMSGALGLLAGGALALLWGAPKVRREQRMHRRLSSYTTPEQASVVTPLHSREDRRATGAG